MATEKTTMKEWQNEKTPFGALFTPALTGCPPASYRITNIIATLITTIKTF